MTIIKQCVKRGVGALVRVPVAKLKTNPAEFQTREQDHDRNHVQKLMDAIRREGELDPIVVWHCPDQGHVFILAGHHRLRAYRALKWKQPLRARVFEGTIREARLEALRSNKRVVLSLTTAERQNAAWRLVCHWTPEDGYAYSVAETYRAAGISTGQVSNMRRVRAAFTTRNEDFPATWWEARHRAAKQGEDLEDVDRNELLEAQFAALDAKIGPAITEAGYKSAKALALVLTRRLGPNSHIVASFCQTVGCDPDELEELEESEAAELLADAPF